MANRRKVELSVVSGDRSVGTGYRCSLPFGHVNPYFHLARGVDGSVSGFDWCQLRIMALYTGRYLSSGSKLETLLAVLTVSFLQSLLRFECIRKLTFDQWGYAERFTLLKDVMAVKGFYLQGSYREQQDHCIRCCWCHTSVFALSLTDNIIGALTGVYTKQEIMHRQGLVHAHGCVFVSDTYLNKKMEIANITKGELLFMRKGVVCENFGIYNINIDAKSYVDNLPLRFITYTDRGWPLQQTDIMHFANAGFEYTGFRDSVMCVACKGQLRGWNCIGINPFVEHNRWFPKCPFIRNARDYLSDAILELGDKILYPMKQGYVDRKVVPVELRCVICMENQRDVINMPCMHYASCSRCFGLGGSISAVSAVKCSICRQKIHYCIPVYLT